LALKPAPDALEGTVVTTPDVVTTPPRSTGRRRVSDAAVIAICAMVTVMEGYNLIVYGAVVPLLLADRGLGIGPSTAGVVGSLVYVGMLVGALSAGVLGDRLGRQPVLAVSVSLFLLGAVCAALAGGAAGLGGARLLAGLGVGGAVSSALALARDHAPRHRSSLTVTITMAGIPVGGTLAALVGMYVLPRFGWRPMFAVGAVLTALILVVVLAVRLGERPSVPAGARRASLGALFTRRRAFVALLITAAAAPNMFTWFGLNTWMTEAMAQLDYPLTSALLFAMTLTLGAVAGSFLTAGWADRWGPAKVGAVTSAATVAGLGGIALGIRWTPLLVLCIALMGMGGHTTINLINSAASILFPEHLRGTAIGWTNSSSYLGAIGPAMGGLVLSAGFGPYGVFALYGASAVLCMVIMTCFAVRTRHEL
jgi:AAHS family benzoate transporter-like MFS transporter